MNALNNGSICITDEALHLDEIQQTAKLFSCLTFVVHGIMYMIVCPVRVHACQKFNNYVDLTISQLMCFDCFLKV